MACNNTMECTCTYSCSKHGKCCECITYHLKRGEAPACLFSKEAERSYDRSVETLYKDYMNNKRGKRNEL